MSLPAPGFAAAPAGRPRPAGWALASLSLSMLMPSLDTSIANVGLPALARAFGASFQEVQWIVLAYLLAVTTLIVGAGRLGDLLGRRRLLLAGIGLFTAASALCGLAPTLWLLVLARAAQGLGAALMLSLTVALVGATVPRARTGRAMGLLGTMSAIGTTLGPSLGGVLIALSGWRVIFLINVPLGVLNLLLALRGLPVDEAPRRTERASFDGAGTLLLALTLATYALAMTPRGGTSGHLTLGLLLAALLGLGLLLLVEGRVASPLLQLATFGDRRLSAGLAMTAVVSTVVMATLVVGPFYLSRALGLDPARVGLVMSVGPLVAALAGIPAGRWVDRLGTDRIGSIGLAGMAVGFLVLSTAPRVLGVPGYVAAIALVTAHYALFQAANNTSVMRDVGADRRGVVSGLLSLSRNLGLVTGASGMGAVFARATAAADLTVAPPPAVASGMQVTFAVAAVLVLAALAIALRFRPPAGHGAASRSSSPSPITAGS